MNKDAFQELIARKGLQPLCPPGCQDHPFSFKSLGPQPTKLADFRTKLCPFLTIATLTRVNIWPQPNFDDQCFMPSFIKGTHRNQEKYNVMAEAIQQAVKKLDVTPEIMYEPEPNHRKMCQVCREKYECYHTHIKSRKHKMNIRKSSFEEDIKALSFLYSKKTKKIRKTQKTQRKTGKRIQMKTTKSLAKERIHPNLEIEQLTGNKLSSAKTSIFHEEPTI